MGMGPWPFDRLLAAVRPLCADHDVFVQTGTSTVSLDCPNAPFLTWAESQRRLREADVVVTHGGNTVRLVQRLGKLPVAVAREAARGEMRNDHQVEYLAGERRSGRVVVLDGDLAELADVVAGHEQAQEAMRRHAPPLPVLDEQALTRLLAENLPTRRAGGGSARENPFAGDPSRRYAWSFDRLSHRRGLHLDLGTGDGRFAVALHRHTALHVVAARSRGPSRGRADEPGGPPAVLMRDRIPVAGASMDSVSMLNGPTRQPDGRNLLAEVHRVLVPGGLVVVTVPARAGTAGELLDVLGEVGFRPQVRDGANLFRPVARLAQLRGAASRRRRSAPAPHDGTASHRAELFLTAIRQPDPA